MIWHDILDADGVKIKRIFASDPDLFDANIPQDCTAVVSESLPAEDNAGLGKPIDVI